MAAVSPSRSDEKLVLNVDVSAVLARNDFLVGILYALVIEYTTAPVIAAADDLSMNRAGVVQVFGAHRSQSGCWMYLPMGNFGLWTEIKSSSGFEPSGCRTTFQAEIVDRRGHACTCHA